MSIGNSGRIVIEVEPEVKRELYAALALEGATLKEWFLRSAHPYLSNTNTQITLPLTNTAIATATSTETAMPLVGTQTPLAKRSKA